jgi:phosphatidylethanolamine-binding protein (PEBP) family uncharacterized protein
MQRHDRIRAPSGGSRLLLGALCVSLGLIGCGGSGSSLTIAKSATTTTAAQRGTTSRSGTTSKSESPPRDTIGLQIPVLLAERFLPTRYTCDGGDLSVPLRWEGVPHGTAELALFILNVQPVDGKTFVDWAVAGLSPALNGITAGQLPQGAVVGRNGFGKVGYSICPEHGQEAIYIAALFALPHQLPLEPGFDAATLHQQVERLAYVQGLSSARYKRP